MRLTKLIIQGFKSFAARTEFEFPKNFVAVVGPNGSGKSNIADAIRWVLGEQSLKLLRGKQSQDVIFHGSENLSKVGMAHVELHFDNRDHQLPIEYSEVVISRKLFRNGESEYRINKALVRLQDIVILLARAKFGLKTYTVVGQGMITHFLNASPQERKIFFDEATGVREFQIKRDQAINKLIRTEEHLTQSQILITEIDPRLRSLTRQVKRLERREKIETELHQLQVQYYGTIWYLLQKEHDYAQHERQQLQKNMDGTVATMQNAQTTYKKLLHMQSGNSRYDQLQRELSQLLEEKSRLVKEHAILRGKLELEQTQQGELELVWLERKEEDIRRDLHATTGEREARISDYDHARDILRRSEFAETDILKEIQHEEQKMFKLHKDLDAQQHVLSIEEIRKRFQKIIEKQTTFLHELLATRSLEAFRTVQTQAKHITQELEALRDELHEKESAMVEQSRVELKHQEQRIEQLMVERNKRQREVQDARVRCETLKMQVSILEQQEARLSVERSRILDERKRAEHLPKHDSTMRDEIVRKIGKLEKQLTESETHMTTLRHDIEIFHVTEEKQKIKLLDLQNDMQRAQRALMREQQELSQHDIHCARLETRQEDLAATIHREIPDSLQSKIFHFSGQILTDIVDAERRTLTLRKQIETIGTVDKETIKEYEETKTRFDFIKEQTDDLEKAIHSLEKIINELDLTIHRQFQSNFKRINDEFQKYFRILFTGGSAHLALLTETEQEEELTISVNTQNNSSAETLEMQKERELIGKRKKKQKMIAGIEVMASPPGKKITNISALSGGEKSLVAIALLCAILANTNSPFVVLDEIEAALDEENSEKLIAILQHLVKRTQIIIITHNRVTMAAADILYGVTMGNDGKSHILSVELQEAQQLATSK